ncbi:MAG: helix-hairpin-helix domain-containing protein, partial [Candidatus Bathyarchaeota archaeon]|nr:helix-hairpin-helix domain-containing protein [Candidatus Bathyarchaeum sp.]
DLSRLTIRVEKGVKPELLPLVTLKGIGRVRARILFNSGLRTIDDLKRAPLQKLTGLPLIGPKLAKKIKEQIGGYVKEEEWQNLKKQETEKQRALTDF